MDSEWNVDIGTRNRSEQVFMIIRINALSIWIQECLKDLLSLSDWANFSICVYTCTSIIICQIIWQNKIKNTVTITLISLIRILTKYPILWFRIRKIRGRDTNFLEEDWALQVLILVTSGTLTSIVWLWKLL